MRPYQQLSADRPWCPAVPLKRSSSHWLKQHFEGMASSFLSTIPSAGCVQKRMARCRAGVESRKCWAADCPLCEGTRQRLLILIGLTGFPWWPLTGFLVLLSNSLCDGFKDQLAAQRQFCSAICRLTAAIIELRINANFGILLWFLLWLIYIKVIFFYLLCNWIIEPIYISGVRLFLLSTRTELSSLLLRRDSKLFLGSWRFIGMTGACHLQPVTPLSSGLTIAAAAYSLQLASVVVLTFRGPSWSPTLRCTGPVMGSPSAAPSYGPCGVCCSGARKPCSAAPTMKLPETASATPSPSST